MTTVKQLIEALQKIENQDMLVEIAIDFENKIYPVYANVVENTWGNIVKNGAWDTIQIIAEMKKPSFETHYEVREMKNK
jgi:hypothetical protein